MKTSPSLPRARYTTAALGCSLAVLFGSSAASAAKLEASGSETATTTTTTEPTAPSTEPPPSETPPTSEPLPALDVAAPPTGDEAAPGVYGAAPVATEPSPAEEAEDVQPALPPPTPFDQGRVRVGVSAGYANGLSTSWFVIGGGVGYFALKGLEVHADSTFWLGGSPFIATVTPGVRYTFHMVPDIKPYLGAFYRHYFVDAAGYDSDSIGGRAGINFMINPNAYVGGGVIVEQLINNNLFTDDTQVYPEITIAFAF